LISNGNNFYLAIVKIILQKVSKENEYENIVEFLVDLGELRYYNNEVNNYFNMFIIIEMIVMFRFLKLMWRRIRY